MYLVYLVIILVLLIIQCLIYKLDANDKYKFLPYNNKYDNEDLELNIPIIIDNKNLKISFSCDSNTTDVALQFCHSQQVPPNQNCNMFLSARLQKHVSEHCSNYIELYGHETIDNYLDKLQWVILDKSRYFNISTLKFPFDLWIYQELIVKEKPTVLIEIGNFHGGSTLWFAHLFDTLHLPTRIIAVDIDHSNIAKKSRLHPRITWIEADAVEAFERVKSLISVKHDRVMIVEDASHRYGPTLQILQLYGTLVQKNGWMIIEDTVLHNGIRNEVFDDSGAYASVQHFISDPKYKCVWKIRRDMERFVMTWNPQGYLQKVAHDNTECKDESVHLDKSVNSDGIMDSSRQLPTFMNDENPVSNSKMYEYYKQWHYQPLDYSRFYNLLSEHEKYYPGTIKLSAMNVEYGFSPVDDGAGKETGTSKSIIRENSQNACKHMAKGRISPGCEYLLIAKAFSSLKMHHTDIHVPMHPFETDTPLHLHPSEIKNNGNHINLLHRYKKGAVKRQIKAVGVSVVKNILDQSEVNYLRTVITSQQEYKTFQDPSRSALERSRYLDPLCASKSNACKIWDEKFLDLIENEYVLQEVESMLGEDVLIDSTTLSIQWPGDAPFGPHVE